MNATAPCGDTCIWNAATDSDALPLTASARSERAAIFGNRVLKKMPVAGHQSQNPLFLDEEDSLVIRRDLLARLRDNPAPHVVQVSRVCECSFESPLLEGVPMRDFALGTDGRGLIPPSMRKPRWTHDEIRRFLSQLATGLVEMHARGVAHGDPVLANAFIGLEKIAVWTDISSVRRATEAARHLDAAGFVELCVWPALIEHPFCSESLFRDVIAAAARGGDLLGDLCRAFDQPRPDLQERGGEELRLRLLRNLDVVPGDDGQSRTCRYLLAAVAPRYFLEYGITDASLRFLMSALDAERTRNAIAEEERTRLLYFRFGRENEGLSRQIQELRQWSTEQRSAIDYHEAHSAAVEEELRKAMARVRQLEGAEASLRDAVDALGRELALAEASLASLNKSLMLATERVQDVEQAEADRLERERHRLAAWLRRMLRGS